MKSLIILAAAAGAAAIPAPERVLRVVDMEVTVAPDGTLALASSRSGAFEIYTVGADGAGLKQLTQGGGKDTPAWSPDGGAIAYVSEAGGNADIFVIGREGGEPARLTTSPLNDMHPFWSPDGKRIVFTRYTPDENNAETGRLDVYAMNAGGSGEKRLVKGGSYGSLSPDGKSLLYWRYYDGNADIAIAAADGGKAKRMTSDPAFDGWPSWSPDGRSVAFAREDAGGVNIFVLDVATKEARQITAGAGRKTSPKWSADGKAVYFDGTVNGAQGLWRVSREATE